MKKPKRKTIKINVLGQLYLVQFSNSKEDELLKENDGYVRPEYKIIVIDENLSDERTNHVLSHEVVHAFLYESGLDTQTDWATNETVVDWIAFQHAKITKLMENAMADIIKNTSE